MMVAYQYVYKAFQFKKNATLCPPNQIYLQVTNTTTSTVSKTHWDTKNSSSTAQTFLKEYLQNDVCLIKAILPFINHAAAECGALGPFKAVAITRAIRIFIEVHADIYKIKILVRENILKLQHDSQSLGSGKTIARVTARADINIHHRRQYVGNTLLKVNIQPLLPEVRRTLLGRTGRLGYYFRHSPFALAFNFIFSIIIAVLFITLLKGKLGIGIGVSVAFTLFCVVSYIHERYTHPPVFTAGEFPYEMVTHEVNTPHPVVRKLSTAAMIGLISDNPVDDNKTLVTIPAVEETKKTLNIILDTLDDVYSSPPDFNQPSPTSKGECDDALPPTPSFIYSPEELIGVLRAYIDGQAVFETSIDALENAYDTRDIPTCLEAFQTCLQHVKQQSESRLEVESTKRKQFHNLFETMRAIQGLEFFFQQPAATLTLW